MAVRTDVSIEWEVTPRIVTVASPSTEITVQDVHDTLAFFEDSLEGGQHPQLIKSAGKEDLGDSVLVGITSTMQDVRLAFQARNLPTEDGTVTTGDANGTNLIDSAATFVTNGVTVGATVINHTTGASATVLEVISETEVRHNVLSGGSRATWVAADSHGVHNVVQCNVSGGNLVALDSVGAQIDPIFNTAFTQVVRTASASATLQQQDALRFSSYLGGVWVDASGSTTGTDYPAGTRQDPVNNVPDAVAIASEQGFETLFFLGGYTFDTGDNVQGFTVEGQNPTKSLFVVNPGANTLDCEFIQCMFSGQLDGNCMAKECYILDVNYVSGSFKECMLGPGTITLAGGVDSHFMDCWDGVPGSGTPVIDMGGSGRGLGMRNYSGGVKIVNKSGPESVELNLTSGHVTIDSTVTAGNIVVSGTASLTDNSTGTTTVDATALTNKVTISEAVWNEAVANHNTPDTFGRYLHEIYHIETGRWKIDAVANTMTFYDHDDNVVRVFDLKDDLGAASSDPVYERIPQ